MPNTYPVASDAKVIGATTAIGARAMGQEEVTLLKQILVAISNGAGPTPPDNPFLGAYLTPDSSMVYVSPDGSQFYQQPAN